MVGFYLVKKMIISSEYFINLDQSLLQITDKTGLYARDWAVLWGKLECSKVIRSAEWKLNFRLRDDQISRLKKFKKYFCKLQMEAIECMRHDVTFYSDVAFKARWKYTSKRYSSDEIILYLLIEFKLLTS